MKGDRCKWLDLFYIAQVTHRKIKYAVLYRAWVNRRGQEVLREIERRYLPKYENFVFKALRHYAFVGSEFVTRRSLQGCAVPEQTMARYIATKLTDGGHKGLLCYRSDGKLSLSTIDLK